MKRMLQLLALHLVGAGLFGCVGHAITRDEVMAIPTFSVDKEVALPPAPVFYGKAQAWAWLAGGAIGVLAAGQVNKDVPGRIKSYLEQEHIDVQQIYRTEFQQLLSADPRFANRVVENGAAHFKLSLLQYGLVGGQFQSGYKTMVYFQITLIDSAGNTLWQDQNFVGMGSAIPAHEFEDYFSDPSIFTEAFKTNAGEITEMLLQNLGK